MEYSAHVEKFLQSHHVKVGDRVHIEREGEQMEGTVMPNTGDPDILVLKLSSGYNAGLHTDNLKIRKIEKEKSERKQQQVHYEHDSGKKTVLIMHTGGTIASKIDYETGGVKPAISPAELTTLVPELKEIVNIKTEIVFQMASDDIQSEHWKILAEKISENYGRFDGFIITHGTDTMHYTSAALSLMLKGIEKPVLLVGSQRSSDRGSSDASMNLICAAHFIANSDFNGVAICMHGTTNDDYCLIHNGLHARKLHTSRRDAFKSIDVMPVAKVTRSGSVEILNYRKPWTPFKPVIEFDNKVAIVRIHPGFDLGSLHFYIQNGYRGIILEGTGLGHLPINETDEHTKDHPVLLETVRQMAKHMIVVMSSQCIFGQVNMNVYSPGRTLLAAGVISAPMTTETAFVKLGWALGQTKNIEDAKKLFLENVAGEMVERIDSRAFIE